jgi:hypothetical protein
MGFAMLQQEKQGATVQKIALAVSTTTALPQNPTQPAQIVLLLFVELLLMLTITAHFQVPMWFVVHTDKTWL